MKNSFYKILTYLTNQSKKNKILLWKYHKCRTNFTYKIIIYYIVLKLKSIKNNFDLWNRKTNN